MISRKERIYHCVQTYTKEMLDSRLLDKNGIDALSIALDLKLDRANVSRELNSLWNAGKVIKIQGRPTLYVDYATIEAKYPNHYIPLSISSDSSLSDFIQESKKEVHKELPFHKTPLDSIIGVSGSLKEKTAQAIAAISYPPHGLPVLLIGNSGVGKREFAESLYHYCLENHILQESAQFIIVNCQDYAHSDERFMLQLLGHKKSNSLNTRSSKGLIDSTNKGIIYFDGLHKLPSKSIDLIVDILKNDSYTRIGDNHSRPLDTTVMASVRSATEPDIMDNIGLSFPVKIPFPDFNKRTPQEKLETILYLFTRESFSIQRNIKLDKSILTVFAMSQYLKNKSQLRGEIQSACSKAFSDPHNKNTYFITITFEHLSDLLLSATPFTSDNSNYFIQVLSLYKDNIIICEANGHCDALDYYKNLQHSSSDSQPALSDSPKNHSDLFEASGEHLNATLSLLVVCHGQHTASDMLHYTEKMAEESDVLMEAINYTEALSINSLLDCMSNAVERLNRGSGVLVLADIEPIIGMEASLRKRSQVPCRILPSITLKFLMDTILKCSKGASLNQFIPQITAPKPVQKEMTQEEFINHLVNDILSRTLLYVNPKKATDTLMYSLNIILDSLEREYTQEIAVKYLSHGVHMIERIIRNIPLPYYQIKQFTNVNHQLMDLVAQSLSIVSDTFAISIPSSEIAYLAEIFLHSE